MMMNFGILLAIALAIQVSAAAEGDLWRSCQGFSLNANNEKWGYFASEAYPSSYAPSQSCNVYFNLNNPQYEMITWKVLDWSLDNPGNDRLTMYIQQGGSWYWINDFYYYSDMTWLTNYRNFGNVRWYWYTDPTSYQATRLFRMTWTFQKYVFGCELSPQPYMVPNTTNNGVLKSPFFPDTYPVNSYCTTVIDVDQAMDNIEFKTLLWNFRQDDYLYFYVGDAQTNDWVQYAAFTTNPETFTIYGNDVKVLFTSDHTGCSYGYLINWRVIKRERYQIFKKESLIGFWPLTAAHRGQDIIRGCNAGAYPPQVGQIQSEQGPFGNQGGAVYFDSSYLNMTSANCAASVNITGSYSVSAFVRAYDTTPVPLVEFVSIDPSNYSAGPGARFWIHYDSTNKIYWRSMSTGSSTILSPTISMQTNWRFVSAVHDLEQGKQSLATDAFTFSSNAVPNTTINGHGGFHLGFRDEKWTAINAINAGNKLTGSVSCLSMYSQALTTQEIDQVRTMCSKIQQQYTVYKSPVAPYAWWPLIAASGFRDMSGNGFHLVAQNEALLTLTTGPSNVANTAYRFSTATDSYLKLPLPTFNPGYGSFSVSFYLRSTDNNAHAIFESFGDGGSRGFFFWNWPDGSSIRVILHAGWGVGAITVNSISFSSWRFVTMTYAASSGTVKLFLDCTEVGSTTVPIGSMPGFDPQGFYVGRPSVPINNDKLVGDLACLSFFKVALDIQHQQRIRNACLQNANLPPLSLLGLWPFTGLTGFNDISGNEIHATPLSSSVTFSTGPFGVPNTAITLGADATSYVKLTSPKLAIPDTPVTISMFVRHTTTALAPIFEYSNVTNYGPHIWVDFDSVNRFYFCPSPGYGGVTTGGFTTGKWQFITATFNPGTGEVKLYRDVALMGSATFAVTTAPVTLLDNINIGFRDFGGFQRFEGQIACLSIYLGNLGVEDIGRIKDMCHNYLLDTALQDQSIKPEINCNFDNGFCGWSQSTIDDGIDWQLEHDETPTGGSQTFYTGPRFGASAERSDALDRYAVLKSYDLGINRAAKLLSPPIYPGWHCFEFWYYMGGVNTNLLQIYLRTANRVTWTRAGQGAHQWNFVAIPFFVPGNNWEQIVVEGWTGTGSRFSDIAIDNVRLTEGRCVATTPCPPGWLEYGRKCYMDYSTIFNGWTRGAGEVLCRDRLKARLALPEDEGELAFLKTLGNGRFHLQPTLISGVWSNAFRLPLTYLPWASGYPMNGSRTVIALDPAGFWDYIPDNVAPNTMGIVCEVTKLEAQHLGFNCTFDNKHLCGWWNALDDNTESTSGGTMDVDVWSGYSLPWANELGGNGPDWDWTKGNNRGYYVMNQDKATSACSRYSTFYSPLVRITNKPLCLTFKFLRRGQVGDMSFHVWSYASGDMKQVGIVSGDFGEYWRTFRGELNEPMPFIFGVRFFSGCASFGNQAIDDVQLIEGTCRVQNFEDSISTRPWPSWVDDTDSLNDWNFRNGDSSSPWRQQYYGDNADWTFEAWMREPGWRRTGPQQDNDGENFYANLDTAVGGSLTGVARLQGPSIPAGTKCFIFHYFQYGYDVGEIRLVDNKGRYLWAMQGSQSPAWQEHRILFTDLTPTPFVFEGSSGLHDGVTHFQKYQTLQLDTFWLRNGSDLCLGYMDCDFDSSAYISTCGWYQNDTDDADWVRNNGETPAGNSLTGPGADHSTGVGHYLYFEATGLNKGAKARVHTPPVSTGKFCLTFYYHMWGADVGGLRVFYVPQNNLANSGGKFPPYTETTLWEKQGQQGNMWIRAMVPIQFSYPQTLTFEAVRGTGDRGDIAIDDVVLLKGACPVDRGLSCSFERGDFCSWYSDPSAQRQFVINRGKTRGSPMTGPEGDATGAYAGGFYAYLPTAGANPGDAARLVSPKLPAGTVCLSFAYNMRGRQLGQLAVYRNSDQVTKVRSGATGYDWRRMRLVIKSENATFSVVIEATRGAGVSSEIAIDDIQLTDGPCNQGEVMSSPVYQMSRMTGYALVAHEMLPTPVPVDSASLCIGLCRRNPGCLSIDFDTTSKLCQLNNMTADLDPYNFRSASASTLHIWALSPIEQLNLRLSNLCTLDSLICNVTSVCSDSTIPGMTACKCTSINRSCYMPQDCSALYSAGYRASGDYLIQPSPAISALPVWCDMDVAAETGFTALLVRRNGGLRFQGRTFDEYSGYFGSPNSEYWIGLEAMHQLTSSRNYGYVVEGSYQSTSFTPLNGLGSALKISNRTQGYAILSIQDTGSLFDAPSMVGRPFSAIDRDADTSANFCAREMGQGGWWYRTCGDGMLTGPYRPGENLTSTRAGLYALEFNGGIGLTGAKWKIARI